MIGVDSNVIVRLIARDDVKQTAIADRILDRAGSDGLFVSQIVLAEVAWVLRRAYRFEAGAVLDSVEALLNGKEFKVERRPLALRALDDARTHNCGYADALIALLHDEAGAEATLTFDVKAKRLPTMRDAVSYK